MKKFLLLIVCAISIGVLAASCSKNNGTGDEPDQLKKMTWKELVSKYNFLSDYPVYDGEIENHVYDDKSKTEWKTESIVVADYKCEKSVVDAYKTKLEKAGFVDEDGYGIYRKETDAKQFTANVSHNMGTGAFTFSTKYKK